jgi:ankyrin repeat protein
LELFLQRGASLEERSVGFVSPLTAACSTGQLDAMRWLIARGAALQPSGAIVSPIQAALGKGDCAAAALLLDAGLPLEDAAWGVVAATMLGSLPMLQWLVARGLDLDATYPRLGVLRAHALQAAVKNAKTEIAAYLRGELHPGPPPSEPPSRKTPPSPLPPIATDAERGPLLDEARTLIVAAGKAATRWAAQRPGGYSGELLISSAACLGVGEIVDALLQAGADPNFAPAGTPAPLYRAAEEGHADLVELLLAKGADPNGADGKSWLPLLGAARSGVLAIVQRLLTAGARPKAKPAGGGTLAQNARGPFAADIRALLEAVPVTKPKPKRAVRA